MQAAGLMEACCRGRSAGAGIAGARSGGRAGGRLCSQAKKGGAWLHQASSLPYTLLHRHCRLVSSTRNSLYLQAGGTGRQYKQVSHTAGGRRGGTAACPGGPAPAWGKVLGPAGGLCGTRMWMCRRSNPRLAPCRRCWAGALGPAPLTLPAAPPTCAAAAPRRRTGAAGARSGPPPRAPRPPRAALRCGAGGPGPGAGGE